MLFFTDEENINTFRGCAIITANSIMKPIRKFMDNVKNLLSFCFESELTLEFLFFFLLEDNGIIAGEIVCSNNKYIFTITVPHIIPIGKLTHLAPSNKEIMKNVALKKHPINIRKTKKPRRANLL
ncbi:hypothetical protein IW19_01130 [Flavobacterium reichenbachii]|uniref:Uncharacterized protein n=1 Tax=Flavobacterium reichenbachii TaxID=362418 RepID=A0A085ZIE5_9FLAO|nr:hypothetical protein IW19_01130 [Flavobacterium reichenbachii]